jgi:hypothetical protein
MKGMYNFNCVGCGTLVAGFNTIDGGTTVTCPGTSGTCWLQVDTWTQVGAVTGTGIAICVGVDGTRLGNSCWYNGGTTGWPYTVYSDSSGVSISVGNHSVFVEVYDAVGGSSIN